MVNLTRLRSDRGKINTPGQARKNTSGELLDALEAGVPRSGASASLQISLLSAAPCAHAAIAMIRALRSVADRLLLVLLTLITRGQEF